MKIKDDSSIQFQISGPFAYFFKVGSENHKDTYLIPTYIALQAMCQNIYWCKEDFTWVIDRVRIMSPLQQNVLEDGRVEMKDVCYQVEAHIQWAKSYVSESDKKKHLTILRRKLNKGGNRPVYLGEQSDRYLATVIPCEMGEGQGCFDLLPDANFGTMLHSPIYEKREEKPSMMAYCEYEMKYGYIKFLPANRCPIKLPLR